MISSTYEFNFKDLKLNSSRIETLLGYNELEDRELVTSLIEATLEESREISNVKAQFTVFDKVHFDTETKSVEINNIRFHLKKIVYRQVKKSDSIAIFLCTAGDGIGIRSSKAMKERDFLKGYICDIVGSEIVEAAADLLQEQLEKSLLESGKKITNRFSPGYCGWDVAEQHKLFELVPENFCGIKLTPSALMNPVKSISGIIGIGNNVKYDPYTCRFCDLKDCVYRRTRDFQKQ